MSPGSQSLPLPIRHLSQVPVTPTAHLDVQPRSSVFLVAYVQWAVAIRENIFIEYQFSSSPHNGRLTGWLIYISYTCSHCSNISTLIVLVRLQGR